MREQIKQSLCQNAYQARSQDNYQRIWKTVQQIPTGKVACYGQIADLAGLPGRSRLVGKALSKLGENDWQGKEVPWFRVINSQGKVSFAKNSDNFNRQKALLESEGINVMNGKVCLKSFQWQPDLTDMLYKLEY